MSVHKKTVSRIGALLLALVMMLSLLPTSVLATGSSAEETIYVLAGGDFQEAGDSANSVANVRNILTQVSQKYSTMNGFLFVGDYDCETHNDANATADGIKALMDAVQKTYSNLNDANSVLVQGNHDYKDSRIDATGGHEFDGYSAYVLNEDDYPNSGGSQAGIQTLANNLKTWLNNKIGEGYDRPVFIVSHLPLAFTPRTVTQGDAKYAKYIFDVLNDAGANGLNIIFLHGHDHAFGPDNYMGGEAIYLPVGDQICIAEAGSTSAWTEETLNFTYMNAGYTGYYSDPYTYVTTAGTDKLTMTVFAITDNQVTVERYSEDGLYNLKSAGYDGSYSNTSVTNVSLGLPKYSAVYASPQTIALVDNGAADMGTIGQWVGVTAEANDDVTTSGNGWVTITEPVAGGIKYVLDTDGVNTNTKYLIVNTSSNGNAYVLTNNNGSVGRTQVSISNGEITVTDDTAINWIFSGSESGTVVNQNRYVYLDRYTNLSLTESGTTVTFSNQGNGAYRIYRYSNSRYNYLRYSSNSWSKNSTRNESDVSSVYLFAFDSNLTGTNGTYGKIAGDLTYNATAGMTAEEAMALVKAGIDGYVYEAMSAPSSDVTGTKVDDGELKWEWADAYQMGVPGDYAIKISYTYNGADYELGVAEVVVPAATTYYAAEGNGLYLVDMNTTADQAMAAVKAGITVYSADNAEGTGKTAISDDNVKWNWVDTYNGADSGPYTVEILKDDTSLGTVKVKVNIKYETGLNDWTYIGETEATGGTHTYTLDTDGIDAGSDNKYIIVARNQAYALYSVTATKDTSNNTVFDCSAPAVTINGNTVTTTTRDYEYYFTGSGEGLITKDGTSSLYQVNYDVDYGNNPGNAGLDMFTNLGNGYYRIYDGEDTPRSLYFDGTRWTVTSTDHTNNTYSVRLYKYTGTTGGTPAGSVYALIEGGTVYTVTQGSSATKALAAVKAGITGYTATDANGTGKTEIADSDLTWKWKNTFNGNSTGSYWVEISYQGKVLGTVEVKVEPGVVNNYPEYPDEGSVKVNKTGTGIDFQSSGIAQVEVSASGVPIKKGADVIVMLDTSSSMAYCLKCGSRHETYVCNDGGQTRAQVLEESLADLIAQFNEPGADGQLLDIRVAIGDFNGFNGYGGTTGTPYDRDEDDHMNDTAMYTANGNNALIYTGNGELGAGAFVNASELKNTTFDLNYDSGTNYDYAMDAIYQMGAAIKEANGSEERDLYVVFMSDGAAMQWNYYHSQGASNLWENWITGAWTANQLTSTNLNCTTHAYYYDLNDHDGDGRINEHRMANAIKGDPSERYEVIRKTTAGISDIQSGSKTNLYTVPGLGAKMFAIAFDPMTDSNVEAEHMVESISTLASDQTGTTQYFYNVATADALGSAFDAIGSEIAYAAYNARFVDQMGDDYNLQMAVSNYDVVDGSSTTGKTITPKIEIISYDIYQASEVGTTVDGVLVTSDMVGNRKGTYTVLETVTFNNDGTEARSDKKSGNILIGGVIYAQSFWYNTNATAVAVEGVSIPTGTKADGTTTGSTNMLPSETFYWKMGTVQTSELAMRYYVYLTGSMEGTREAGSYPTNEYATLYYDNYLGNPCKKDTVSPVMPWKEANVSYAFYLVNEDGDIVVNQTTGQTGSFANKIAVTNPVVYSEVLLNSAENVQADILASNVLPEGYTLYDTSATYNVRINSNSTGGWTIKKGTVPATTTYVTEYGGDPTTQLTATENSYDYTHTTVWFAVVWKVQALPDTVVIDYGLPVDISVLTNDMFGENGKLAGVGAYSDSLNLDGHGTTLASGFSTSYTGTYGSAKADESTGKVRYTLNTMEMNGYDKFAYAVNYTGATNPGYYYDTVTVIPATTIYYEDSFLTYSGDGTQWEDEGTAVNGATQAEDRPGQYSLTDANNIYGYDAVNNGMATFSLGTAKKVHVDADSYATATFTFAGTGFDVISMTSNTTGVIAVEVTDASGTAVANRIVNTYYGYTILDGKWVATPDTANSLYQVPVLQVEGLPYGTYTAKITATYMAPLDKTTGIIYDDKGNIISNDGYDLYLDAIRIYDPANDGAADGTTDTTIEDAYKADGEGWPSYIELRNKLIAANGFDNVANEALTEDMEGLVFIDGNASVGNAQISDYVSYGPNNEVYLAAGQSVAFLLSNVTENVAQIHIGIKSANGASVACTIENIAEAEIISGSTKVSAGTRYNKKLIEVNTTTDMYYDMTGWKNDIVVISNTGTEGSIISLTNIKATYKADPNGTTVASEDAGIMVLSLDEEAPAAEAAGEVGIYMTPAAATLTLRALNAPAVEEPETPVEPDEPVVPEEPETPVEPDEPVTPDEPEQPEEPEVPQQPSYEEIVETVVKKVVNTIKSLFNWLFK